MATELINNNIESLIGSTIGLIIFFILTSIVTAGFSNFYLRFLEKDGDVEFKDFIVSSNKVLRTLGYNIIVVIIALILIIICAVIIFSFSMSFILIPALLGLVEMSIGSMIASSVIPIVIIIVALIIYNIFICGVALTPYVIIENEDLGVFKSMKLSKKMMKGNKWKLFILYISFIGWAILSLLTLGIGFLWLRPYITLSMTNFYKEIISE